MSFETVRKMPGQHVADQSNLTLPGVVVRVGQGGNVIKVFMALRKAAEKVVIIEVADRTNGSVNLT